ncbi:hypothetical protein ACHAP5_012007 [Fusarium lateritium]
MPVTFNVVNHSAAVWKDAKVQSPEDLLEKTSPRDYRHCQRIIQTSFTRGALEEQHVSPSENGFVWSAYHAYSQHHHLVIRPEDVWFAILTQISFFINANAEDLRAFFVDHEDQKELEVIEAGSLQSVDFGALANRMASLISKNVRDPELGSWVMPSFTSTSDTDRVVASVIFMGAMQKYFSYGMTLTCGIPSVTLLGEISDWQDILGRLDLLEQLGKEPSQFAEMLRPILKHMILSFEQPTDARVLNFWNTIATKNPVGSGTPFISGWITAFCFWDDKGKATRRRVHKMFDGVSYPTIKINKVPVGFAAVPVKINDNGNCFKSIMLAGSLGIQALPISAASQANSSTDTHLQPQADGSSSELVTIQPLSGWLIYEDEDEGAAKTREDKKKTLRYELKQIEDSQDGDDRGKLWKMIAIEQQIEQLEAF